MSLIGFLLVDAAVGSVVRASYCTHKSLEPVRGARCISRLVGQQKGGCADTIEAIRYHHRPSVPAVVVAGNVPCADNHRVRVAVNTHEALRQVQGDGRCAASHSRKVVEPDIATELEVVHDHFRQRGYVGKAATIDDQDINFMGCDGSLRNQSFDSTKDRRLDLLPGIRNRHPRRQVSEARRKAGHLSDTGPFKDQLLKLQARLIKKSHEG
ncbi:hypothetical protein KP509_39G044400 [Ceratopteris richardii]|uniref:Uncharacterized protein n=1 Tax=Ceratopteris richardii TaxID=49495 RepID=A0A8T2Q0Z6_CERRI|nr:hypothetical protein KP509_39G044400 [Ceratopteris richardii]